MMFKKYIESIDVFVSLYGYIIPHVATKCKYFFKKNVAKCSHA
nr:MAG TPA: hypothetical protein [Bacteriophage sp.]